MSPRVLVVEDDRELREMLHRLLSEAGHDVTAVADGHSALHRALTDEYDLLIVDRGLPAIEGLDLIARLRRSDVNAPILVLTAYGSVADRVAGLDAGAEDYMVKPFEIEELLARVRALLRRGHGHHQRLAFGSGGVLDVSARQATAANGRPVELSGRETQLLQLLASRPTHVFTREELRRAVFDSAESASIVDTYVHYLRRKLGNGAVRTVRGAGYRIGSL
jgi:two-component system response regulator QseB